MAETTIDCMTNSGSRLSISQIRGTNPAPPQEKNVQWCEKRTSHSAPQRQTATTLRSQQRRFQVYCDVESMGKGFNVMGRS